MLAPMVPQSVLRLLFLPLSCVACFFFVGGAWSASASADTDSADTELTASPAARDTSVRDTVVARYAGASIPLAELDSAFVASAGGPSSVADSSLSAYRAFLDQYLNYRLKVRAARDAGLDTLRSIRRDVHTYRQKLARPEVLREEVYEPIARTVYERRQHVVDVSHILIRTSAGTDTAAARRTLQAIADSLERGVPFAALAYRNSDDPSAREEGARGYRGRLGTLQAGQVVKPFEDRMYTLEPGQVSAPFRTKYGYHLLKVHDRRPALPPVELSHILRRGRSGTATPRRFLDSLRTRIVAGTTSFAAAARRHSQDPRSATKGGALGTVDPQGLPSSLRSAVRRLDSVGAVSDVVDSRFGHHLLRLTGRQARQSFDEAYASLKEEVAGGPRVKQRRTALARKVRAAHTVTVDTTRLLRAAGLSSVDSLARPLLSRYETAGASPAVAALGDSTYTLGQMARHLMQTDGGARTTLGGLLESFLNEKALQHAVTSHAQSVPELARQVRTYREGTLLFRYMQDSVWTAAARDTAGLRATYRRNRAQYRFPERVRTLVLRAPSDSLLRPYRREPANGRSLAPLLRAVASDSLVAADTAFVTARSPEVYQPIRTADDAEIVGPVSQGNQSLLMIRDTRLPPRPKGFQEARSSVLQDHQEAYEQRMVQRLRTRYDAHTYPERIRRLPSPSSSTP